jgi:membrane protein
VFGLRGYLAYAIGHSPTYGALSAPVAALLFLYFTALAVLLGAEINAQVAGCRHDQPSAGELEAPSGELKTSGTRTETDAASKARAR